MYTCNKCNKTFNYESEFKRHQNRKIACNLPKKEYKCDLCNVSFISPAQQKIHENTKKHSTNVINNGDNNINVFGNNNNINNNLVNLTLNINSFKDTDTSYIGMGLIRDIGNYIYPEILENNKLDETEKIALLFDEVIRILKRLHFNIGIEENHNLKILLVFPGLKHKTHEYLILEINKETKKITWKSVDYSTLLMNIFDHLLTLNDHCKNENYIDFVNYLKINLIDNEEIAKKLHTIIDNKLSEMYTDFNKEQNKPERDIKETFKEKLDEYINYRNKECRLNNGYNPEIINSQVA